MPEMLFDLPEIPAIPMTDGSGLYPIGRIFCVGRNYAAHAAEMGNEVDREAPFYFTKSPANAVRSGASLPYPPGTQDYHHEMELYMAIGTPVFHANADQAAQAIHGFGAALDMTRRDLQGVAKEKRRPWDLGKDVEGSAVFGDLTPAAAFGFVGPQRILLRVNGNTRQDAYLADMIHTVTDVVSDLSKYYHLRPGDLILTGTPAGVGPVKPGDKVSGEIEGLSAVVLTLSDPA
ncbi:MAG: fumarylacetoacetate hydrolase family protein [Pseudomonadota bacterium]